MALALQLEKMTLKEKLQVMEALWDSIAQHKDSIASPAWHEANLKETETRYLSGEEMAIDWETAKKELRKRLE